jgi:LETM1 and EF-hand domain-containing protein 1
VKEQGSKFTSRYDDVSYSKQTKIRQVKKDFIKFVPFSFFLIVPGAELFLPAWIMIFPNSIPSQFLSDKEREDKFRELKEKQIAAAEKLNYIIPNYLARLARDDQVIPEDKE